MVDSFFRKQIGHTGNLKKETDKIIFLIDFQIENYGCVLFVSGGGDSDMSRRFDVHVPFGNIWQ